MTLTSHHKPVHWEMIIVKTMEQTVASCQPRNLSKLEAVKAAPANFTPASFAASTTLSDTMNAPLLDQEMGGVLDSSSLEAIVELKISRFLEQIGTFYPENMYSMIMKKVEKPLIKQILLRTGGNQVHAARILGINRNTLRKKMKLFGF